MAEYDAAVKDALEEAGVKRTRQRQTHVRIDRREIADRVVKFYEDDQLDRTDFISDKLQRYAKYRMWNERSILPWEDASDITLPNMMSDSLRMQDTLNNAFMMQTPPISATAKNKDDKEKESKVDKLIQHQMFIDVDGESVVAEAAECFVNDGIYVIYNPWVRQQAKVVDVRVFDPIPDAMLPSQYFRSLIEIEFEEKARLAEATDEEGWDWEIVQAKADAIKIKFYTKKANRGESPKVEMVVEKMESVFDGPRPIVMDIDDVLFPWRSANLDIPGPSNPYGAPHVILRDYPTIDEIAQLQKSGYYDLIKKKDVEAMERLSFVEDYDEVRRQKDDMQGTTHYRDKIPGAESHGRLTRLICFDRYDIDGDGINEDVIFWVIKESKLVLRARLLTEVFPSNPPMRPVFSQSFIPIKNRAIGISLLEQMESLVDTMKELIDQSIDNGTLSSTPFFFYKPTSTLNPEIMHLSPGEGVPLGDPRNDINFPQLNSQGHVFGLNMVTIIGQMIERLTMTSDLNKGQIPAGKATALRTASGMQTVLSQGEARPERLLRRFFKGFNQLYAHIHELNQRMLPEDKKVLVTKNLDPAEDPYQLISDASEIRGSFHFDFDANILNASKAAMQEAINAIMSVGISEIALQLGIVDAEGIYRMIRDMAKSWGQDPNIYFKKPTPTADMQQITAQDALLSILNGIMPGGVPTNGWVQHLEELKAYAQAPEFGSLENKHLDLLGKYLEIVTAHARQEQQTQQNLQAARQFQARQQQQANQGQGQQGSPPPDMSNQQLSGPGEAIDKSVQ